MKKVLERTWNNVLKKHLRKYYKNKKVRKIETIKNSLGNPIFRQVTFTDGSYVTFAKRAVSVSWFRHSGGGRYEPRSRYEGKSSKSKKRKR